MKRHRWLGSLLGAAGLTLAVLVLAAASASSVLAVDSRITTDALFNQANGYPNGTKVGDGWCFTFGYQVFELVAKSVGSPARIGNAGSGTQAGGGYGYYGCYVHAGGVEVSQADARRGDYIQIYDSADPWNALPTVTGGYSVHTAIIQDNLGGGVFNVIDQNGNPRASYTVFRHQFSPSKHIVSCGGAPWKVAYWRLGSTPPTPRPAPKVGPATSMVIDVSGSMADSFQGDTKIDKAKEAAATLVQFVKDRSALAGADGLLSVTAFTTDASRPQDMTTDYGKVDAAVATLQPQDSTNLAAGIEDGLTALANVKTTYPKTMILLSDGMANTGVSDPDAIIAGPVARAKQLGIRIYTIGFGDPGAVDSALLQRIATASGGQYSLADATAFKTDLDNLFISAQVSSTANVVATFQGTVAQGATVAMGTFKVPLGSGSLQAVLNWPGSRLRLDFTDPGGRRVQAGYPGFRTSGTRPLQVMVKNAKPGTWTASVYGEQVSQPNEPYYSIVGVGRRAAKSRPTPKPTPTKSAVATPTPSAFPTRSAKPSPKASKRPSPKATATPSPEASAAVVSAGGGGGGTGGGSVLLVTVVLVAAGLIAWLVVRERAAGGPGGGAPELLLVGADGREFRLRAGANSVGRDFGNDVMLDDPSVSRRHASVVVGRGGVDLQDVGSTYGTNVNGLRVRARRLNVGDEIAFGAETLWLRQRLHEGMT